MRPSILLWSTVSGVILGLFIDATLIGVALLFSVLMPPIGARFQQRWFGVATGVVLVGIPLVMAVLGFLEGRLKAV
jgi:hypothetical protein